MILRKAAALLMAGLALGVALSLAAASEASALLFGLKPRDPAVFDPKTFVDHATYQDPAVLATDVLYLLVNGQFGVDKGS
jgi:hypothetical protein